MDRLAPGRHVTQGGNVQISKDGHGDRARYWRCRHDQVVWLDFRLAQPCPLFDTELVLLVYNRQTQLSELDLILHDGVRTDHYINFVSGDLL